MACYYSGNEPHRLLEEFVKNKIWSLSFLATLAIAIGMISWGGTVQAQTEPSGQTPSTQQPSSPDTPPTQQPSTTPSPSTPEPPTATSPSSPSSTQSPDTQSPSSPSGSQTPDTASPSSPSSPSTQPPAAGSTPDSSATAGAAAGSQVFSGTVEKQGDKYVLKDDAGKVYDIDHQTDVAKFEGKRVRVQGTLDETGKKILVK